MNRVGEGKVDISTTKGFFSFLAERGDKNYQECLELFPDPSSFIAGTTFRKMPCLLGDLTFVVENLGPDVELVRQHAQRVIDTFREENEDIGVRSTLNKNYPSLCKKLDEIGVEAPWKGVNYLVVDDLKELLATT